MSGKRNPHEFNTQQSSSSVMVMGNQNKVNVYTPHRDDWTDKWRVNKNSFSNFWKESIDKEKRQNYE